MVERYIVIHLLWASIVWIAALALTSTRRGSATVKYWIWVATLLNFIVPLGAALDRFWAPQQSWITPLRGGYRLAMSGSVVRMLAVVWLLGCLVMIARLVLRIRASTISNGPAVIGLLRPTISLPDGIDRVLTERELDAVLLHERTHALRRDNLLRLMYEVILCGLWFHPLVWITGTRLALYRELSCDEPVIANARGEDLLSALAKLAEPGESLLLQATASSFIGDRVARLLEGPRRQSNLLLVALFIAITLAGVFETVALTAGRPRCTIGLYGRVRHH